VAVSKNPSPKAILHGFLSVTVKVSELLPGDAPSHAKNPEND